MNLCSLFSNIPVVASYSHSNKEKIEFAEAHFEIEFPERPSPMGIIFTSCINGIETLCDSRVSIPITRFFSTSASFYNESDETIFTIPREERIICIWDCRKMSTPVETRLYELLS